MTGDRGRLQVIPGLRTGNVLAEPFEPLPGIDLLGIKPFSMKCSACGTPAKWHLTACPGTDHAGHVYACGKHLARMHRSMLEDVACKPHQHEEPRTRPPSDPLGR